MKSIKIIVVNLFIFIIFICLFEMLFGFWFKKENFGIYMRKERRVNWHTESSFYGQDYKFFYKRNRWGFRGDEFDSQDVQIIFEGGSTGNQRFTPEELTIVGHINKKFENSNSQFTIFNASTDGKSLNGYINDFEYWFPKIPNFEPEYVIFYLGINDRLIQENLYLDLKISETKFARFKDYIKNNSFIVDKYKIIKNKFFPKNTFNYDLTNNNLYDNFKFIDFHSAKELHKNLNKEDLILIKKFKSKLKKLNTIIIKENFKPIFITQIKFDGLSDKKLYLINNEIKKFSKNNGYFFIPLDEILKMDIKDFYDPVHTTPQGSFKIAEIIYKKLEEYLSR